MKLGFVYLHSSFEVAGVCRALLRPAYGGAGARLYRTLVNVDLALERGWRTEMWAKWAGFEYKGAGVFRIMEMTGAAQRADKRIGVSVAEYDGYSTTFKAATEKIVNGTHTVQAAVREAYAAFPQRCLRVKVRRNGEFEDRALWYPGDPDVVWRRELYDVIADGDEVVIVVSVYMSDGPRKAAEGAEALGGGRSPEEVKAAGPQGAWVVADLLRELARVGAS